MNALTIIDALDDPLLFAPYFKGASWDRWRGSFLKAFFALPMSKTEAAIYRHHTGRETPPTVPFREGWVVVGRRGGKSRIAALVAVYLAALRDWTSHLAAGEVATIMVLAADRRQARVVFRYCKALLTGVDLLRPLLVAETRESLTLSNGACIEIHAISQARTRGYTLAACICDEICFWGAGE